MVDPEDKSNPEIFAARTIQTICRREGLSELQTNRLIKDGLEMRERQKLQKGSELFDWVTSRARESLK